MLRPIHLVVLAVVTLVLLLVARLPYAPAASDIYARGGEPIADLVES